jgi:hypothetical protein
MQPLPQAATFINEAQAHRYPALSSVVAVYNACSAHQVTTCDSCSGLWRLDQLSKRAIGYYPGAPGPQDNNAHGCGGTGDTVNALIGEHYAWRCPVCHNDLTDRVLLHHDACASTSAIRATAAAHANA